MELSKIIKGLQGTKSFLQRRINGIETAIIGLKAADSATAERRTPKFSPAARERIAAAQRKRWRRIKITQKQK